MISCAKPCLGIAEAAENLVQFALDRSEMRHLMDRLPPGSRMNLTALEYEFGLLKILAVGWAIAFYCDPGPVKDSLTERFWNSIHQFCLHLSTASSASMGREFNYFDTLRQRLETYVGELQKETGASDPAAVIGPKFAELCGHRNDPVAVLSGGKMLHAALSGVRTYLQGVSLEDPGRADEDI